MQVVHERCARLDVHKKTGVVCRITPAADGGWRKDIRTFGTLTDELLTLADWLRAGQVSEVAMEKHQRVLEANRQSARSRVRGGVGQCPAHQVCARRQDRRE